jgi:hypothetical protein
MSHYHLRTFFMSCLVVAFVSVVFLKAAGVHAAQTQTCGQWNLVTDQNPGQYVNNLTAATAAAANDVWAVGDYMASSGFDQTLIEHWNGNSWSVVPSPSPGQTNNFLLAVAKVPKTNQLWAVGEYDTGPYSAESMIEHWDGSKWSSIPNPNPGTQGNELSGIVALSATNAWAVGVQYNNSSSNLTLIEHWDGKSWQVISSPNPGILSNYLYAVAAVSAHDIWAVGYDDMVVGGALLTEHWNGKSWSVVSDPTGPGDSNNVLTSIARIPNTNHFWAVGSYVSTKNLDQSLVERWNGTSWTIIPSPNSGNGTILNSVTAFATNNAWAVGYYTNANNTEQTLTEHWNGTSWSIVSSPNVGSDNNFLSSVTKVPGTSQVWSVGDHFSNGTESTYTEFYC